MPVCNTCGVDKLDAAFPKNGKDKDGKTRRRPDCNVCYNIKRKLDKGKHTKFMNNTKHRTGEEDTYILQDWKDALIHFGGCCAYCGTPQSRRKKLTRDHVLPVTKDGTTVRKNIIPSCNRCNCSKSGEYLEVWYPQQRFYSKERMERINAWRT
jgi:hypothetical protein